MKPRGGALLVGLLLVVVAMSVCLCEREQVLGNEFELIERFFQCMDRWPV